MRDSCAEGFQLVVCVAGVDVFVRVAGEFHSYFRAHAAVSQHGGKTVSERVKAETGRCASPVRFYVFPSIPAFSRVVLNWPVNPYLPPFSFPASEGNIGALPMPGFFRSSFSSCGCRGTVSGFLVLCCVKDSVLFFQSSALHCMLATSERRAPVK